MCIIISKNKNCDRLPTIGELKNCFNYNNDGAGFMYINNGKVTIDKGFMTLNSFLEHFEKLCDKYNNFKNKALVVHCRIGTSAGNIPENTHPYIISTKEKDLHKLNITSDLGVVHNGIISDYTPKNKGATVNDTQKFIMEYLAPIYKHYKGFYKNEKIRAGIKNITNSKFVFLDKYERTYYVGDFIDENGLKFSNTSYKNYMTYLTSYNTSKKYDSYFDDYLYDDFYECKKASDLYYDYYDAGKNLIYLESNWFYWCEESNSYENVSDYDFELIYSLDNASLFCLDDNGELLELAQNVRVYDDKFYAIL